HRLQTPLNRGRDHPGNRGRNHLGTKGRLHRNRHIKLLEELRQQRKAGKRVYLATDQEHVRAAHLVEALGLGSHCDGIYYSAALGSRKPDQAFFKQVAALSGLRPDQLLLVDDPPANIDAARLCGWNAIHWQQGSMLFARLAAIEDLCPKNTD
ncbi:HAD-IA family hydrolase, partial [Sinorhizobium meliloti]|uniref:HAD-IA family hydrolase n=1 Tax=Rhizobium meliloti TaxID=382 RepID=UPI001F39CEC0